MPPRQLSLDGTSGGNGAIGTGREVEYCLHHGEEEWMVNVTP